MLGWTIVGAVLASTAALVVGIGLLARTLPEPPTPHSATLDEPPADAEDIGEQPEERSLNDERELREPSWGIEGERSGSSESTP